MAAAGSRRSALGYLMAAGTVVLWGASFPVTKAALDWLGPFGIAFLRWAISAGLLFGWLAYLRKLPAVGRLARQDGRTVLWVAASGITLFYALENLALRYTTAINAGVLANLTSVFMVLLGLVWLGERLRRIEWLAVLAALAGAILVSLGAGHLTVSAWGLRGDALMVAAAFLGAVYSVGAKLLLARHSPDVVTATVAAVGALLLLPLAGWEGLRLALPASAWVALLLLGVGSGALANLWWLHILRRTPASRASMILLLIPLVSTIVSVILLRETLTLGVVLGALLVLGGIALMQRGRATRSGADHD